MIASRDIAIPYDSAPFRFGHDFDGSSTFVTEGSMREFRDRAVRDRHGDDAAHVLVVDDQEGNRSICTEIAETLGFRVSSATDAVSALRIVESDPVDILLTDVKMPGMSGIELLERVKELSPGTEVVIMSAFGSVTTAVQAMKMGAYDYLTKPFNIEELSLLLERIVGKLEMENENQVLREQVRTGGGYGHLLGTSAAMQRLYKLIAKVSQNHYPVLIQGESGTGKELVARQIHESGPLSNQPFMPIDCSSLVPTLIESELFGYVRGAFTGANRNKEGLLETAGAGTVFLDEIGEMPIDLQAKFLRALQEKEIRPVGSSRRVHIEARVIAATNRDLEAAISHGGFRKDLYFRLNVVSMRLPALRERKSDIPLLVDHFLHKFRQEGQALRVISEDAMKLLIAYDWPGNVRELEHCVERAVALGSGPVLQTSDLTTSLQYGRNHISGVETPFVAAAAAGKGHGHAGADGTSFVPTIPASKLSAEIPFPGIEQGALASPEANIIPLAEMEKQAILNAIRDSGGDKLMAAKLLGIGKTTLYRKLKEYGQANL